MKKKLMAQTPHGPVYRTTARNYTHVVVVIFDNGDARGLAWAGSQRLAEAQLKYWTTHLKWRFDLSRVREWELSIHPVVDAVL